MAKSKETFSKREMENRKRKQRQEKNERKLARKDQAPKSFDDMIAYLDENGNLTTQPVDIKKKKVYSLEEVPDAVPKAEHFILDDSMHTGNVQYFSKSKGFGFINDSVTGERIFVHKDQCNFPIMEGDKVTYILRSGDRGLLATLVRKAV
ncbi:cold shock domain-containing protein [Flaviaesturariibacter amylovorans]|uniref:Cold shock domain-containing protein n=1 Tax=Flaviaesturariibacter amylovorans TaxID=1084520 RepID=A0ABP8H7M1_9BACT